MPQKRREKPQYKLNTFFNEGKQTCKRRRVGETQKRQKNTVEITERKNAAKILVLFVLKKNITSAAKTQGKAAMQAKHFLQ